MNKPHEIHYYEKAGENNYSSGERYEIISFINEHIKTHQRILEVGCGTGEIVPYLSQDAHYFGVDISSYAIEEAKKKYTSQNHIFFTTDEKKGLSFFEDEKFDIVLSVYSIEHVRSPKEYLLEMNRILIKNGYLIIIAPNLELPFAYPTALRHRSKFYRLLFLLQRLGDYFFRLLGLYRFRIISPNFTEYTGKYEKLDDDLTYVTSTYEVVSYLKKLGFSIFYTKLLKGGQGLKNLCKRIITYFPGMKYYGDILFVIMKKND